MLTENSPPQNSERISLILYHASPPSVAVWEIIDRSRLCLPLAVRSPVRQLSTTDLMPQPLRHVLYLTVSPGSNQHGVFAAWYCMQSGTLRLEVAAVAHWTGRQKATENRLTPAVMDCEVVPAHEALGSYYMQSEKMQKSSRTPGMDLRY